jgi:ElaB/YqjD/DUF883 family membrane-anchored ribosome-binding protein
MLSAWQPQNINLSITEGGFMADTNKSTTGTGTPASSTTNNPMGGQTGGQTLSASATRTAREQSPTGEREWGKSTLENLEQSAKKGAEKGAEVIEKAKENLGEAYDRASRGVTETWGQAVDYTRSNPGTATLVAFGAGIGVGLMIASSLSSRSRTQRIAPPVIRALSEIAGELFR